MALSSLTLYYEDSQLRNLLLYSATEQNKSWLQIEQSYISFQLLREVVWYLPKDRPKKPLLNLITTL